MTFVDPTKFCIGVDFLGGPARTYPRVTLAADTKPGHNISTDLTALEQAALPDSVGPRIEASKEAFTWRGACPDPEAEHDLFRPVIRMKLPPLYSHIPSD